MPESPVYSCYHREYIDQKEDVRVETGVTLRRVLDYMSFGHGKWPDSMTHRRDVTQRQNVASLWFEPPANQTAAHWKCFSDDSTSIQT